ncbi:MAG: hypothetical protein ABF296_03520 [Oceanococcaceae bacterium]
MSSPKVYIGRHAFVLAGSTRLPKCGELYHIDATPPTVAAAPMGSTHARTMPQI